MHVKSVRSRFFSRHVVELLMGALILEILASPLADTHPHAGLVFGTAVLAMVLAGIGYIANTAVVRRVVIPVAAIWMVTRTIQAFADRSNAYANLAPIVGLVFSCTILWAIFAQFRTRSETSRSVISQAFISYLVIATAYSQVYWILNRFVDHAFNQIIPYTQNATLLYFSMVTLTSVGYGGIVPVNPYVRNVAALESMSGIFFVAVVVARLVSAHTPRWSGRSRSLVHETDSHKRDSSDCTCAVTVSVVSSD
jgi:hypothetical protein